MTPSAAPTPPAPGAVSVSVLNATSKAGLAHQVAAELRGRGFRVTHVGNTTATVAGAAAVTFGPCSDAAARTVVEHVGDAVLTAVPSGGVTLELGPGFTHLRPPSEAAVAHSHDLQAASPRPPVCSGP